MKADCPNLLLGEADCVNGADKVPTRKMKKQKRGDPPAKDAVVMPLKKHAAAANNQADDGGVPYRWPLLNAPRVVAMDMGIRDGRAKQSEL